MRKIVFYCLSLFFIPIAHAMPSCETTPFKIEKNTIILREPAKTDPGLYFLKNKYDQSIWIDRVNTQNRGMSAGFASYLRPNHWSALISSKPTLIINCAIMTPGKVTPINCDKVLTVCAAVKWTLQKSPKGTYWLGEDKEWDELAKLLEKRGVGYQ